MNINLKVTGIEITPAISDYVDKKINALKKYIDKPEGGFVTRVEIGKTTHHHKEGQVYKAEVHITGSGMDVYAVAETEDLYASIDMVKAEMERELVSAKTKKMKLLRKSDRTIKDIIKGFPWVPKRFRQGTEPDADDI